MTALRPWWAARTARERALILIMLALAGAVALWLLLLRPLESGLEGAKARHAASAQLLVRARADAEALSRAEAPPPLAGPVQALVERSAAEAGFADAAVGREGEGARVAIASARPPALFAWAAELERAGLIVVSLSARSSGDGTVAAEAMLRPASDPRLER